MERVNDGVVRLGTRGSALALAQAEQVQAALQAQGIEVAVVVVRTTGDLNQRDASTILGTGVFVKELEAALLGGRIDMAVHSAKDLPTAETGGLLIAAYLHREDPRDALIGRNGWTLRDLPRGGRVGSDSPRRRAFILAARPDLEVRGIRGNVDTRLRKLAAGDFDAIVVAAAGLRRLGLAGRITETLAPEVMLPAAGQGALAVQTRVEDEAAGAAAALDHAPTRAEITAERAFLSAIGGGCRAPIAALGRSDGDRLTLEGAVISPDGRLVLRDQTVGHSAEAATLGAALAHVLLTLGAAEIYQEARA